LAQELFYANKQLKFKVMKKTLLTGFIIAIAINFAAAFPHYPGNQTSNLTLTTSHAGRYMFELNGFTQQTNGNTLQMHQIQQGIHNLRIFRWRSGFMGQGFWDIVYQGQLQIPANSHVIARWDQWNGLHAQITPMHNGYIGNPNMHNPNHPPIHNPGYGYGQPGYGNNYGGQHGGHAMGMNPQTFQGFMNQLRQASFDSNKVTLAKNGIRNNGISVNQLQQVLREFSFDSNRLDVAKFAYNYTVDRNNYFLLHSSFDFESNANHLMNSIH